ncbi:MAG: mechanosensitive ion channel family protein [Methylophilaceae bacterium]
MRELWAEVATDLGSEAAYWQLAIVGASLLLAWALNKLLHRNLMQKAPETWKVGVGGLKRMLFPLTTLVFVYLGKLILQHWQHTSLLTLASTLLVAMALVRLAVYTLRYIFSPSAWLKTTENAISGVVWLLVALHLVGFLPEILRALDEVSFSVGKVRFSLLLIVQSLVTVAVTVVIALWLSRLLENRVMRAERINMNLRVVVTKLLRVTLTLVGVLAALSAVGFDITLLSVFGGALGVGLGFGLQKIASNYVSGFIILLDESVHLGDVMTIDGHYGVVSQIRSRYLVLRKLDGTEVVIPNETLIGTAVINHSFTDRKARINLPIQISYESGLEDAMTLMRDVASQHPRVLKDPPPETQILGFGENGIDLQLVLWIPDPEEGSASLKSSLYLEIWHAFQKHGVAIPYPQRDVRIVSGVLKD